MNRLITSMLLLLSMSCLSNKEQPKETMVSMEMNVPKYQGVENTSMYTKFTTDSYELKLELYPLDTDVYNLVFNMKLKNNSYYVSPNSKGNFKGVFSINVEDNNKLQNIAKLIETPASVEEFDSHPSVNSYVNRVKENTSYVQKIKRKSDENFIVTGTVQFTIEPRCTLEKIPFFIKYHNGKIKIEIDRC